MSLIDVIVVENKVMTIKVSKSYKYNKLMAYIAMLSNVANKIKCVQVDVEEHINIKNICTDMCFSWITQVAIIALVKNHLETR